MMQRGVRHPLLSCEGDGWGSQRRGMMQKGDEAPLALNLSCEGDVQVEEGARACGALLAQERATIAAFIAGAATWQEGGAGT